MKLNIACWLVVAGLVCNSGCKSQDVGKTLDTRMVTETHLFIVTGGVPVKQTESFFYYRPKCITCGAIATEQIGSMISKETSTVSTDYTCPKCGHGQTVRIVMEEKPSSKATATP
jgi:DNA-directed RNA polymerase subunit RPC12/RpoP